MCAFCGNLEGYFVVKKKFTKFCEAVLRRKLKINGLITLAQFSALLTKQLHSLKNYNQNLQAWWKEKI